MSAPHVPSDDTAIRAADERKMANAERHARETFEAWLTRLQHPVASERLLDAIRAANSERWNQMERALKADACSTVAKPSNGAGSVIEAREVDPATPRFLKGLVTDAERRNIEELRATLLSDPSPITAAPNGERR